MQRQRDVDERLTRVETELTERTRVAAEVRGEIRAMLEVLTKQQAEVNREMGRLNTLFEAHLAEDRRILSRLDGHGQRERMRDVSLGSGIGAGVLALVGAIGKNLGWW